MLRRIRERALVVMGLSLAAVGCSDDEAPAPRDGGVDAGTAADASARCNRDDDCGSGFCDRAGRCQAVDEPTRFGMECSVPARVPQGYAIGLLNTCGAYLCLEGRCRSCMEDAECQIEYNAPACRQLGTTRGYRCGDYSQVPETQEPPARGDAGVVSPPRLTASVVRTYPHDPRAFTERLISSMCSK